MGELDNDCKKQLKRRCKQINLDMSNFSLPMNWVMFIFSLSRDHMVDESRDSMVVVNSIQHINSHSTKIGGHCLSEGGDKAFFLISRDHLINESRDSVGNIPST